MSLDLDVHWPISRLRGGRGRLGGWSGALLLHPLRFGYSPNVERNARAEGVSVRDATFVE
jgi:hypothetical protein